jgi:hypothetical protein
MSDYDYDFDEEDAEVSQKMKSNEKPHSVRGSVVIE